MDGKQVWIAGKAEYKDWPAWEFTGVFDSEEKAVATCLTNQHFVAPYIMNEVAPEEISTMQGCYYPLAKKEENDE